MTLPITARIDGREVSREEVRAWERKRADRAARFLGIDDPPSDLGDLSRRLVDRKLELGHEGIERMLDRRLKVADAVGRFGASVSGGRRRICTIELARAAGSPRPCPAGTPKRSAPTTKRR